MSSHIVRAWLLLCYVPVVANGGCRQPDEASVLAPALLQQVSPWPEPKGECPHDVGDQVARTELQRRARLTWQRGLFDWKDGPQAVGLVQEALACARVAGDLEAVDVLHRTRRAWRAELRQRLNQEALRLELAARRDESGRVLLHSRRLLALLQNAEGRRAGDLRDVVERLQRSARVRRRERLGEKE